MQAIQLTPNSWLMNSDTGMIGLLCKKDQQYKIYSPTEIQSFDDHNSLLKHYKNLKFIEERESVNKQKTEYINGYPVKHHDIVVMDDGNIPLYTKGGNAVYCAGYWAVKFNNGWTQCFCPKATTMTENECEGPFKTKLEMLSRISVLNKEKDHKRK